MPGMLGWLGASVAVEGEAQGLDLAARLDGLPLNHPTVFFGQFLDCRLDDLRPDLGEIGRRFGSTQVRASGTVVGNIANGSPIGDWPPAFIALGATVELRKGFTSRILLLEDEQAIADTLIYALHSEGFNTPAAARPINQAAFSGLLNDGRGHLYLLRDRGVAVAGAALFIADNGVAYLGTAFTTRAARGQGHHRALIGHRVQQALVATQRLQARLQRFEQGRIAEMGSTDADRVKLHFEIRKQGKPVDPTKYLPSRP